MDATDIDVSSPDHPSASGPPTLVTLPADILLHIFKRLPNTDSLTNAILVHTNLYATFMQNSRSVATAVLLNEIPDDAFPHAVVSSLVNEEDVIPAFGATSMDEIQFRIIGTRLYRHDERAFRPTLAQAVKMAHTHRMVEDLANLLIADCAYAKGGQHLAPLAESIESQPVTDSEKSRVRRALYLLDIVAKICRNLDVQDGEHLDACLAKMAHIQKCITQYLMAPWEMYQIIAVQACFRRLFYGFDRDAHVSERLMQGILASGLDFAHRHLCRVPRDQLNQALVRHEERILAEPPHAISMILSRGRHSTWTRSQPREFNEYVPFWEADSTGFEAWKLLETAQLKFIGTDPMWADLFDRDLAALEGRLDLWSAALWDAERFGGILESVTAPVPDYWYGHADCGHACDVGGSDCGRVDMGSRQLVVMPMDGAKDCVDWWMSDLSPVLVAWYWYAYGDTQLLW